MAEHEPTSETRAVVRALASVGTPQTDICKHVGLTDSKTLRKHYRAELDEGKENANDNVARTLYKLATIDRHPASCMFWLKCQAGWRETDKVSDAAEVKLIDHDPDL